MRAIIDARVGWNFIPGNREWRIQLELETLQKVGNSAIARKITKSEKQRTNNKDPWPIMRETANRSE